MFWSRTVGACETNADNQDASGISQKLSGGFENLTFGLSAQAPFRSFCWSGIGLIRCLVEITFQLLPGRGSSLFSWLQFQRGSCGTRCTKKIVGKDLNCPITIWAVFLLIIQWENKALPLWFPETLVLENSSFFKHAVGVPCSVSHLLGHTLNP